MTDKTTTAPADRSDTPAKPAAPLAAKFEGYHEREGVQYPTVSAKGDDAPRKGSAVRVTLSDVTYIGKVYDAVAAEGRVVIRTEGLTPEK